jgi:cyclin C
MIETSLNQLNFVFFDISLLNVSREYVYCIILIIYKVIHQIGKSMGFRQRLIATAVVLFKRFYTSQSFIVVDPFLVAPTILFVASKVEECPCKLKNLLKAAQKCIQPNLPNGFPYDYTEDDMIRCEFHCLEVLEFDLVVYHPYDSLLVILNESKLAPLSDIKFNEVKASDYQTNDARITFEMAWKITNDTLRTDLCLYHPPYVIALAVAYITANFLNKQSLLLSNMKFKNVNILIDLTSEILDLYDFYSKKHIEIEPILKKLYFKIRDPNTKLPT